MRYAGLITDAMKNCLEEREARDRIFPFLWLHEAPWERVREELDAIYSCGLRAVCLESRTHQHFCEDEWWQDVGRILAYAKEKGMQVWILDDKHFPTGYANFKISEKYPHLKRKMLKVAFFDYLGPANDVCNIVPHLSKEEKIVSVSAFRRTGIGEEIDADSGMLLTDKVKDGLLYWNIPDGVWRVYYTIQTVAFLDKPRNIGEDRIDMCSRESCEVMIKEIYEPHYAHFSEYFGNTLRGFFSDEPCFGTKEPWRDDMVKLLAEETHKSEKEIECLLPALFCNFNKYNALLRIAYMNILTALYRDNFCNTLGEWCEKHNVLYIGHIIEDVGRHTKLGNSVGHYFRALEGQHMSGVDIVLNQISPGITDMVHTTSSSNIGDASFYHHVLTKLGTSSAHLDDKKHGRVMGEVYGAFGWAEGIPTMKYLTDVMVSGGVNYFVPHAFSDKLDDPDCPPIFYNGGKNPQFAVFGDLMSYLSRLAHILGGGETPVPVAIYYNAESEWSGEWYQDIKIPAAELGRCGAEYDFVPRDNLVDACIRNNEICVGKNVYQALIVPACKVLTRELAECFNRLSNSGARVIYVDNMPLTDEMGNALSLNGEVVTTDKLEALAVQNGWQAAKTEKICHELRMLCRKDEDKTVYFFFNASLNEAVDTRIDLEEASTVTAYDAWNNKILFVDTHEYRLHLEPREAVIWCVSDNDAEHFIPVGEWVKVDADKISVTLTESDKEILKEECTAETLKNYANELPRFHGNIVYRFDCTSCASVKKLRFNNVGEIATLRVNGVYCGSAVEAPYAFSVDKAWQDGNNDIELTVTVNQAYLMRDGFSVRLALPPMGWLGAVEAFIQSN